MKCCLCHKEINGYGNNPWGALNLDGSLIRWKFKDKCCDECNRDVVVPHRILLDLKARGKLK